MTLEDGPLDIIGDIHGEFDALMNLLDVLGYDEEGQSPEGRKIVFLGDLIDRGPDSPA
ncbi:MAG: metallophosphoesterase, partial [Gammaproteobacteria bacterium]|nr:metallophosphoesterase [Gammaproteobacteria bacterium]